MMVQWFKNLAQNIGSDEIISTEGALGEGLLKKVAVLLDFVQLRGGRALPKFFVHFSQTVYIGSIWGWGGRGRPLPKFFGTLAFKKSGICCQDLVERRGVEVI